MAHLSIGGQENPAPPELIEHILCDRYKWTLQYVRALPLADVMVLLLVMGEASKANNG